jgi:hypothetical protein
MDRLMCQEERFPNLTIKVTSQAKAVGSPTNAPKTIAIMNVSSDRQGSCRRKTLTTNTDTTKPTVSSRVNSAVKKQRSLPATATKTTVPIIVKSTHAPPLPMPAAQVRQPDGIAIATASNDNNHSRRPNLAGRRRLNSSLARKPEHDGDGEDKHAKCT